MNTQHTPGPWKLCYDGQIDGPDGRCICRFGWDSYKEFTELNNAANARLIAAAPDLLEALKLAISAHGVMLMTDPPQEAWRNYGVEAKARAAIAKATGEQP
jgi:hypothetical protein